LKGNQKINELIDFLDNDKSIEEDCENYEYVPRNTNNIIRYFNPALLKLYETFEENNKTP
jgi:hypothetical protein